jgi:hypothetical protein
MAAIRLRISYTNLTHGDKIRDELKPHCEECDQEVTVEHLIWQCAAYNSQRRRNSITKDLMDDNEDANGETDKVPQRDWTAVQHIIQEENDKKWKTMDSRTKQEQSIQKIS